MSKQNLQLDDLKKLHQAGHLQEAKKGYLELLKTSPNDAEVLHLLGILFAEQGDLEKAQHYLEKGIRANPKNHILFLHLANVLKAKGLFSQAAQVLEKLTQDHPRFAAAFNNLGTVYYAQAKLKLAAEAYDQAIRLQPNYIDAYYNLGLALHKLNRKEEAINTYQALLELAPQHPGARFHLGCLFMENNDYKTAIEHFSLIESDHPFHFETQTNIATSYLKSGDLEQALLHYKKALAINPQDVQVIFNLGVITMQQGAVNEAIQFYLQAVQIDPNLYDAQHNLAFAFLMMKKNEEALHHFREALRIQPDNTALAHTINILSGAKDIKTSPPEYVRALFNSYADHFDVHLNKTLQYQVPHQFLQLLEESAIIKKPITILDLGCGTGLCGEVVKPFASSLTGIDISEKMLEIAAQKNTYDRLIHGEILPFLNMNEEKYDLIMAGDVFVYFGELDELFVAISKTLTANGLFLFDTEISERENYIMDTSGRFVHSKNYLEQLALKNHFRILRYKKVPLRMQNEVTVYGHLYLLQREGESEARRSSDTRMLDF